MSNTERAIISVSGSEREDFLQGLISNDIGRLKDGLVYAGLLTPQGKLQVDFFLVPAKDQILIDVAEPYAQTLLRRLTFYKLRADVQLAMETIKVSQGVGEVPAGAHADPRHPEMGWRAYGPGFFTDETIDWEALRVANCIPEMGVELIADDTYILEAGFERINGVDFRKGCYVGQEVTARMKHKTELRKGLAVVDVDGEAPVGSPINKDGKAAGTLFTQSNGRGIAYLRFDRAGSDMIAGPAGVKYEA